MTLKTVFKQALYDINTTEDGQSWLTDAQQEAVYDEVTTHTRKPLIEANKAVWEMLLGKRKIIVDQNHLTGEQSVPIKLLDFTRPDRNSFKAIIQFRIDTPGMGKGFIIPDIVLFINGLPLVVVECRVQNEFTTGSAAAEGRAFLSQTCRPGESPPTLQGVLPRQRATPDCPAGGLF